MRRSYLLLLLALVQSSLWREALTQEITPDDCIANFSIPGAPLVPRGVVCMRCVVGGVLVENPTYEVENTEIGPDSDDIATVVDGVLIFFDTRDVFDVDDFTSVSCESDDSPRYQAIVFIANVRPPIIMGNSTINEGGMLSLMCDNTDSNTRPRVEWLDPMGEVVSSDDELEISPPNTTREIAGTYTCRTLPGEFTGSENSTVEVVIQYAPEVMADNQDLIDVPVGIGDLQISCTIDGVPPPDTIVWIHNSTITLDPSDPRITIENTTTSTSLTVEGVRREEGGVYTCDAGNVVGNDNAVTSVRIQLPPGPPTNLEVVPNSETTTSLDISWDVPSFNGFSPISGYRVQILVPGQGVDISRMFDASTTQQSLVDLDPLTEYTLHVFAMNEVGLEGDSDETTGMTESFRLGMVRSLVAVALSSTEISLSWQEPMFNPNTTAPPDSYRVTYSLMDGAQTGSNSTAATSLTLAGLRMGTVYSIFVVPINSFGDGVSINVNHSTNIDPPSMPQFFEGENPDPFTLIFTWTTPLTNGGRPLIRYELTITNVVPGEVTVLARESDEDDRITYTYSFNDLQQNTTYIVTIVAVTDDGTERESDLVTLTRDTQPVGEPQIPNRPVVSDITDTNATISWNNPGGFPTEYRLEVKQRIIDWTAEGVMNVTTTALTYPLSDLLPLTAYDARVLSVNFNGPSDFSPTVTFDTVGGIVVTGENGENGTVEAESGDTISLTCSLEQRNASNPVQYVWTREDGESLPTGSLVINGVLMIEDAQEQDSGVYTCSASGVQASFTLEIMEVTVMTTDGGGVSLTVIIIVVCVGGVALIIFLVVAAITIYCLCFRGDGKVGSPHKRTYSFRPRHWTEASGAHSMPREERREVAQSFHMPDDYSGTTSFNTTDRVRHSPSPPSYSKAGGSHAGAEPTTSFQLSER